MSQSQLKTAIYQTLTADQTSGSLYDDVSGRIWEGQAPTDTGGDTNALLPFLFYRIVSDVVPPSFTRADFHALVQFDLYSKRNEGAATATSTNDKLFALLHKKQMTMTGHTGVEGHAEDRGALTFEDDAIRIRSEFRIRGTSSS